jgi:hypothetical protein
VPPQVPGFNVSVLRQQTFARRNQPVTISGRVTAFGLGLPALVRVFLEGPTHSPEVRTFDTFAAPMTGDYAIPVLAEKDGQYQVYAQAFPPVGIPFPGAPEPVLLGPPLAESPRPPLAVGEPVDGELEQELAPGTRRRVTLPTPTPVEVSAPITFAPRIEVAAPARRVGAAPPPVPVPPPTPEAPAEVVVAPEVGGRITGFEIEE